MSAPIRGAWFNRPGWGEYGAWRIHGKHDGFDSYTVPKATIYGTADGGKVIGKGHVAGGWGHYIDVHYPSTAFRMQYVQRDCHMNEESGLRLGATVNRTTALGRVGQTGNAKGIVWTREGVELWHVHSEVYLDSGRFNTAKRVNPLPVWGATTAGGGSLTPIDPNEEQDDDMKILRWGFYNDGGRNRFTLINYATGRIWQTYSQDDANNMAANLGQNAEQWSPQLAANLVALMNIIGPQALPVDVPALASALAPLLPKSGALNESSLVDALTKALEPQFAAVNANIDDQPTEFKVIPN